MRHIVGAGLLVAATITPAAASAAVPRAEIIHNQYIVVLKDTVVTQHAGGGDPIGDVAMQLAISYGGEILNIYRHAIHGFAVSLPSSSVSERLASDPRVKYVAPDIRGRAFAYQESVDCPLDRIDQRDGGSALNDRYNYHATGINVNVYVVDSGIRQSHDEFRDDEFRPRAVHGYSAFGDDNSDDPQEGTGHGTRVASVVGGVNIGVAKGVTLHAVRMLNHNGTFEAGKALAALNWVAANHIKPAVVNISWGAPDRFGYIKYLDDAVNNIVNNYGITVTVAAGNYGVDVAEVTPARASAALTVSGTNCNDRFWSDSDYGTRVDLSAPVGPLVTASYGSDNEYWPITAPVGTSFSAPQAAGAAALYLQAHPNATPAEVEASILNRSTRDKIDPLSLPAGTPNRLLYTLGGSSTVGVFRPELAGWFLRDENSSGPHHYEAYFGAADDVPLSGDWNGDGMETLGVYRPSTNEWYLRNSNENGQWDIFNDYGADGDIPVVGDWDGDGVDTIGIFRPSNQTWFLRNSNSIGEPDIVFSWGNGRRDSIPVVGDWDGDGVDSIGLFLESHGRWWLKNVNSGEPSPVVIFFFGGFDLPVVGDWNGDGIDTVGVFQPEDTGWYLRNSNTSGPPDVAVFAYGANTDRPVAGDWNGR